MKGFKFLAIFVGLVVDIGGSFLSGVVIAVVMMIFYATKGMPLKEISTQMDAAHLGQSIPVLLSSIGVGGFFTVVGGFVTGWLAQSFQLKNALLMGLLSALFGAVFWTFSPLWYNIVCVLITPVAAAVGGYFAQCIFVPRYAPRK
jgi:hypothetical protein